MSVFIEAKTAWKKARQFLLLLFGARGATRTRDPLLRKQML